MSRILPDLSANVFTLPVAQPVRKRGRKKAFSMEKMCELRGQGMSLDDIASTLDCSLFTVRKYLKEAGVSTKRVKSVRKARKTVQRKKPHVVADRCASLPPVNHPALVEGRTIYPTTVVNPLDEKRCLIEGKNSRKISGVAQKGDLKGFPIYTLTLEERATCPVSCRHWRSCYGNNMHMAKRFRHGPELEECLRVEVAMLMRTYPKGVLIRPHILGDFYSVEYVELWRELLEAHPNLHVFGFTARIDQDCDICAAIARVVADYWPRFAIRFSNSNEGAPATVSIEHPVQVPADSVVCPAQMGQTESCGTCGFCWSTTKRVAFVQH